MSIIQSLAIALGGAGARFLERFAQGFAKLAPTQARAAAPPRAAARSGPEPDWYRFPPF